MFAGVITKSCDKYPRELFLQNLDTLRGGKMQIKLSLFLLQIYFALAYAWFETCDYQYSIPTTSTTYLVSNNYPNTYPTGSSCKWYLLAPVGYTISLNCTYSVTAVGSDCQSQRLYMSRDGDKDLAYANYYCGSSSFKVSSVGNEISVGYTSNAGGNGWIYCEARPVLTTQDNCQCGWNKVVSIDKFRNFIKIWTFSRELWAAASPVRMNTSPWLDWLTSQWRIHLMALFSVAAR